MPKTRPSFPLNCALALALALPLSAAWAQVSPPAGGMQAESAAPIANGQHTLNLKQADIGVLIQTVSEITGRNFIIDPRVEGKVTVVSAKPMDADGIYEVFLSVLRVHGYAAVPAGSMVKILPDSVAFQEGAAGLNANGSGDAVVTRILDLKHVRAAELLQILRPLLPQSAQLIAHKDSNALVVTDRYSNIERLKAVLARIDTSTDASVEVIPLSNASASEVARTLSLIDGGEANAGARIIPDPRTNTLLLSGEPSARLRLRALIGHLDTPLESGDATQVVYLQYAKAPELVPILEQVARTLNGESNKEGETRAATITAHDGTNALIVTASPAVFRSLQAVIRQLDIRRAQVLIEAVIAEVSEEVAREVGVQWQATDDEFTDNGLLGGTNFSNSSGQGSIIGAMTNPLSLGSGLNLGYVLGSVTLPGQDEPFLRLGALVRALRGDSGSNVLSTPSIVTLDHQEAQITVGQEVPFVQGEFTTSVQGSGGNNGAIGNPFRTVERKDVGLKLKVTPHINEGDTVVLDLEQEVSNVVPAVAGAVDLVTNKRTLATSVMVPDNSVLVLGGLLSEDVQDNVQKVPGLGDIPVLGNLFKFRSSKIMKRNLMVFLHPLILRDAGRESAVSAARYNSMRQRQMDVREKASGLTPREAMPMLPELQQYLSIPVSEDGTAE